MVRHPAAARLAAFQFLIGYGLLIAGGGRPDLDGAGAAYIAVAVALEVAAAAVAEGRWWSWRGLLALRLMAMPYNSNCAAVAGGYAVLAGYAVRPRRLLRTPRRGMAITRWSREVAMKGCNHRRPYDGNAAGLVYAISSIAVLLIIVLVALVAGCG